jgi:hypothetical protein
MATTNRNPQQALPMRIPLTYEMLDGTTETVDMLAANVQITKNGHNVSSGSLHWRELNANSRGCFKVDNDNELTVFLPHSGPFAFFFDKDQVCAKLHDKKGLYKANSFAIVPGMRCFVENTGQARQFSVLATSSEQGKELGLDPTDEDANVFTLHTFLVEPPVDAIIGPTRGGTRGATRGPTRGIKGYNVAAGFGEETGTTWTKSNALPASETLATQFRIKVLQRNTEQPVSFTQQHRAGAFEADPVSGESETEDATDK